MMRTLILTLAAAAILLLPPNAIPDAQAQQERIRVELDQSLLDKWLLLMPQFDQLKRSGKMPQSEEAARTLIAGVCTKAGFDSSDQCTQVLGYVGMIVSTWDPRTRSFRDPMPRMRSQLARLEADTSPPTPQREQAIAQMKQVLARFPEQFPPEHVQLIAANQDRVLAAIGQQ